MAARGSSRYLNSRYRRRNVIGMRILAMILSTTVLIYGDVFVATVDPRHAGGTKLLLPNLTFSMAVMLFAVFRFHPVTDDAATSREA